MAILRTLADAEFELQVAKREHRFITGLEVHLASALRQFAEDEQRVLRRTAPTRDGADAPRSIPESLPSIESGDERVCRKLRRLDPPVSVDPSAQQEALPLSCHEASVDKQAAQ
eukprot:TRINITY_DN78437_c0_g1_i1.p1 TRINITY_DN78437_c0_g1~~TRINITY_DN78437_c0_g1_i1.p1  ORF type:complete len:114 (-),score=17.49 TRINITY_DN78437_c0_g1_i1:221-562(-)